ncbi:MAG: phosphotransacetylase family protein [Microcoleus sp. SIO2G3]|nr:phosphotransacetylase family protein [Microcoleus sp. SIO2G3]
MAGAKYLLVGSTEAYSGKSATVLGLAHQLLKKGLDIAYGKPLGTFWSATDRIDEDVRFIAETLNLPADRLCPTLAALDADSIARRISGEDAIDYAARLCQSVQTSVGDLVLLEAAGTLEEGRLFNLSLAQAATAIDAAVVLVARCHSLQVADSLLWAKQCLGDRLLGVLLNDIPLDQQESVATQLQPFLEQQGIPVLARLPRNSLLRSVSVGELVNQLQAEVLCRPDRLDLMVESLTIGAMNVNSALKYFRKAHNMAVVTGGDRTDLQLAALETSTQCLILTGHIPPMATILSRAEDLEIPILSVDLDTLTTVEIVDRAFGQVRLHEPIKVQCVYQMMEKHLDVDLLLRQLGFEPAVRA